MSIAASTKAYAIEVANTALDSFTKQARGDIEAPNGDENVRLYTAKGGSAVTLNSSTTSAAVVFDPEASLRNGQMNVQVYERNSANTVLAVQTVSLGRPSDEFLSVGVMSSGLKAFNSSGVDVIGGTQTAAVLTSVPRDISQLTTTDVSNFNSNHERDLSSGVISRDDATMTMVITEHLGKKMCLARSDTLGNVVTRKWDDRIGSRRTTVGQNGGFSTDTTVTPITGAGDLTETFANLLASSEGGTNKLIFDSSRLSGSNNPLTLATFNAEVEGFLRIAAGAGSSHEDYGATFRIMALSAANEILSESTVRDFTAVKTGETFDLTFGASVGSSTAPIHRVVVFYVREVGASVTEAVVAADSTFVLTATEETADIPARPIHVCVFEGLNSGATLNLESTSVLTGVPDSTNVFISSSTAKDYATVDVSLVEMFMKSVIRSMPRAFTVAGHGAVVRRLTAYFGDEEVDLSFKAMSFKDVSSMIKKVGSHAKTLNKFMKDVHPLLDAMGGMAGQLPGPMGTVGRAAQAGSRMLGGM